MSSQQKAPRIIRRVEMIVPYNDQEISHIHPAVGPGAYLKVGKTILKSGLAVPHGDYTASLVHAAYCSGAKNKPEFTNLRNIARNSWIWVFNCNLWTDAGLYSLHDPKALGRSREVSVKMLERMLKGATELAWGGIRFSKDCRVRFAPKESYVFGELSPEALAKDGAMIVQYGVHGAELCGEASATQPNKPIMYGLNIAQDQNPELRVSSLGEVSCRLHFSGYLGSSGSCAFPVFAPNEKKF